MDRQILVSEGDFPRLDSFIAENTELTRSHAQKLIEGGFVSVNGGEAKSKRAVKKGDVITVDLPEPEEVSLEPENIPLDIIYEDSSIAVINKQQGLTVHAGNGVKSGTLVNALLYHLDSLSGINGVIRPGIVHRIDKDTSGLLVVAKNDKAHISLSKQIAEKTCGRTYLALLSGVMGKDEGRIETYIDRSPKDRTMMAVSAKGRLAVTDYKVIKRYKAGYTLCEFRLKTGRTHQIRVHAKHLGHPVVGDKTYGSKNCKFNLEGQLLHAFRLELDHPDTGERMIFEAPLPEYFTKVLNSLGEEI
ncbi:MAG: RluA family pseudouridine synthase [Clostridia bacterium]|nr:RluA family pseudouridine synthase [Clostridia bacterium]